MIFDCDSEELGVDDYVLIPIKIKTVVKLDDAIEVYLENGTSVKIPIGETIVVTNHPINRQFTRRP